MLELPITIVDSKEHPKASKNNKEQGLNTAPPSIARALDPVQCPVL